MGRSSNRTGLFQKIESNVVARVEPIMKVQLMVDTAAEGSKEFLFGQVFQLIYPTIDRCSTMIVHASLIAKDACLHIIEVVLTALLKSRIVTLLLKLLCLQIVARIKLITDSERNDVQVAEFVSHFTFTSHSQHLQNRILGTVI